MAYGLIPATDKEEVMRQWINLMVCLLFTAVIFGCGGGGSSSNTTPTDEPTPTITGQFIDSAVSGLKYSCSSGLTGETDISGNFTCEENDTATFYLGEYVIGSSAAKSIVTPYDLFPDNEVAAINVARLLQSLDLDGDPSDGIAIPQDFSALNGISITPQDTNFIATVEATLPSPLVSAEAAKAHLDASLTTSFRGGSFETYQNQNFSNVFGLDLSYKGTTLSLEDIKTDISGNVVSGTDVFENVIFNDNGTFIYDGLLLAKSANNQYFIYGLNGLNQASDRVLAFAVNNGFTGATNTLANGDYKVLQLMDDDRRGSSYVKTTAFDISFHGDGSLSFTDNENSGTATYSIETSGSMIIDEKPEDSAQISKDGGVIVITKYNDQKYEEADRYFIHLSLLVKKSSGKSNSTLNGTFTYAEIDAADHGGSSNVVDLVSTYGTITFNGAGSCTIAGPEGSLGCTYSVANDGSMTFNDGEHSLTGMVSPDGQLISIVKHNEGTAVGPFMVIAVKQAGNSSQFEDINHVTITNAFLQYRSWETGSARPHAWVTLTKNGGPISPNDIQSVTVKDSNGNILPSEFNSSYYSKLFINNCQNGTCYLNTTVTDSGVAITGLNSGLQAGDYTVEIAIANGQTLNQNLNYAGSILLPTISSTTMNSTLGAGGITFSWQNPSSAINWNHVSQLRIELWDEQSGPNRLHAILDKTTQSILIPNETLVQAGFSLESTTLRWRIQTRSENNSSRGYSDHLGVQ